MQPLGRKKLRFPGKINWKVPKGETIWWHDIAIPSKKSHRQHEKI